MIFDTYKLGRSLLFTAGIGVLALFALSPPLATAGLVDPTSPYWQDNGSERVSKRGLRLQSTIVSPNRKLAMINGRNYTIGAKVGSAVLVGIQSYEVTLKRAGKTIRLRMLPKRSKIHSSGGMTRK